MEESLFLNTLAFEFPKEPKIFYFSTEDREDVSLTKLSHQLFPDNIKEIFPDISNADTIYTSFDWELEGFQPLEISFPMQVTITWLSNMIAEIRKYFGNTDTDPINTNHLWFL